MDPDLALLARWRAGDRQAGEDLFRRHFADIYRFFKNKARDEADDLAQRTFLACTASRDQFRSHSSFRTYLFAIARNELYGHLRRLPRGEHVDFEVTSIAELVTSPSSRLGRAEEIAELREALEQLPVEQQLLLELHYWHELDADALGEVFGALAGTIRVRLVRARRALRERMSRLDPDAVKRAAGDRMAASLSEIEVEDAVE
jgi:RNA polymerase sigma factor (sigma-70 family)